MYLKKYAIKEIRQLIALKNDRPSHLTSVSENWAKNSCLARFPFEVNINGDTLVLMNRLLRLSRAEAVALITR